MKSSRCEKTTKLCDKREYKEASLREIVLINLHVLRCKTCRDYSHKTVRFTQNLRKCSLKSLSQDQKHILKQQIDEELRNQSGNL